MAAKPSSLGPLCKHSLGGYTTINMPHQTIIGSGHHLSRDTLFIIIFCVFVYLFLVVVICLQCFDTVGWSSGRTLIRLVTMNALT